MANYYVIYIKGFVSAHNGNGTQATRPHKLWRNGAIGLEVASKFNEFVCAFWKVPADGGGGRVARMANIIILQGST